MIYWCSVLNSYVTLLERRKLFGREIARVLAEGSNTVQTVLVDSLLSERPHDLRSGLATVAGARLWSALGSDLFLAPLVSNVLPLPHQFRVLRKALSHFPVRIMLADEVGMGKTIEAGLVFKELKLRGMVDRVLVLAPKSLLLQWIVEMDTLFSEHFDLVLPGQWGSDTSHSLRGDNVWKRHRQVVTSVDAVKPKEAQRGWSREKIERYNVERFHDLIGAGWDLVIIDESHKVAGASEEVSRYELARELGKAAPHLLLLSATPHSGKSDAFRRLLTLLDPASFETGMPLTRDSVESVVIRTEKRSATDAEGKPLFAPRTTRLVTVPFEARHALQEKLYEEVSEYVVASYNSSLNSGNTGSRLLLILLQRLMSSSTRAIRRFLEQRAEVLQPQERSIPSTSDTTASETLPDDEEMDTIAQGILFTLPTSNSELQDVERLRDLALRVEQSGPDARAEALYDHMLRLAQEDGEPEKKFLVFTEFTATQEMLAEFLTQRGYPVVTLNGSMDIGERRAAVEAFRRDAQVLICTDAGGEGLNMQFAHVVFNYDLPYNPMRVEQRIGRVDRIGQRHEVKAINLVLENSVEARLYEIWQLKLARIFEEFGVDKTGDVLDSSEAGADFEKLARTAIFRPDALDAEFDRIVTDIRKAAQNAQTTKSLYTGNIEQADTVPGVPIKAWLATMTGEEHTTNASRTEGEVDALRDTDREDLAARILEKIHSLAPCFAPGRPVPRLNINDLGFGLDGWFAVWKVGVAEGVWRQQQTFATYTNKTGQSFSKAAQRLWDELASRQVTAELAGETLDYDFGALEASAEAEAVSIFDSIVTRTSNRARSRLQALEISYMARRNMLARIGLENVREARRRELKAEYEARKSEIEMVAEALPDLHCLFLARVVAS